MRLLRLNDHGVPEFTRDFPDADVPPYAILSHTWGADDDEVIYEEIANGSFLDYSAKPGFAKIRFCGEQAKKDGLDYFWIDSCCINKPNFTELSKAILSMFRWYQRSAKCYVFLADVTTLKDDGGSSWEDAFKASRWFRRGWTLQELLAPENVEFFSRDGSLLGTKSTLEGTVCGITGLPLPALRGHSLSDFRPNEKLRWARGRQTKEPEDRVYCLLGIFNASIPIQYGSGLRHAMQKLEDEVRRRWNELDIAILTSQQSNHDSAFGPFDPLAEEESRESRRRRLMKSLLFEQMDARHDTITDAHNTTCKWFLNHVEYVVWRDVDKRPPGADVLWITGTPGTGKSTLMKFAFAHARRERLEDQLIVSFFFNARGDELERSTVGLYRSMAWQILQQEEAAQDVLDEVTSRPPWTVSKLQNLIIAGLRRLRSHHLICFFDALDECAEQEIRDMLGFLERAGNCLQHQIRLSVCLASRHYPTIRFRTGYRIVLEREQGHGDDLRQYIQHHLQVPDTPAGRQIQQKLYSKANGIFIWVVLVVDILNRELDRGKLFVIDQRLQEIPQKLGRLFKEILTRDNADMHDLLLCLQWILFAKYPLTGKEFYFAMEAGLHLHIDGWEPSPWREDEVGSQVMVRCVRNMSKGLAELSTSRTPTVQFIHESVGDFLVKEGGLYDLWPHLRHSDGLFSSSHERLKQCCQRYISPGIDAILPTPPTGCYLYTTVSDSEEEEEEEEETTPRSDAAVIGLGEVQLERGRIFDDFPFLEYASSAILFHAEEAAQEVSQHAFVAEFALATWVKIEHIPRGSVNHNTEAFSQPTRTSFAPSMAYLFAERGYSRLLRLTDVQSRWRKVQGCKFASPVEAAVFTGSRETLEVLFPGIHETDLDEIVGTRGAHAGFQAEVDEFQAAELDEIVATQWGHVVSPAKDIFVWAARHNPPLLRCLLHHSTQTDRSPATDVVLAQTILIILAGTGQYDLLQLLLDHQSIGENSGLLSEAVEAACYKEHDTVMQLLLDRGARSGRALSIACANGHLPGVRLLLDHKAEVNPLIGYSRSSIKHGSDFDFDHIDTVWNRWSFLTTKNWNRWLMPKRYKHVSLHLDTDTSSRWELLIQLVRAKSPLQLAALGDQIPIARLLLDHGAEINADALRDACLAGNHQIVEMLVEHGASVDLRNALLAACQGGFHGTVKLLLDLGADADMGWTKGEPLRLACFYGHGTVVRLLLEYGARVDMFRGEDNTPLRIAAAQGHENIVRMLLEHGANPNVPSDVSDADGNALSAACLAGHDEIVRILLDHDADINAPGGKFGFALQAACAGGHTSIVKLLLQRGANVDASGGVDGNALIAASRVPGGRSWLRRMLLDHSATSSEEAGHGRTRILQWPLDDMEWFSGYSDTALDFEDLSCILDLSETPGSVSLEGKREEGQCLSDPPPSSPVKR